ncbi:Peroxidase 40 [Zea mays]|uniref:Peroxidase n=1 Tax=Zea mays TaxID=4577 RepID=A0A3L6G7F5_MAIZE|nr:Peroxidase 40 [Zea mays]
MAHSTTLALVIVVVLALTFGATVSVSAPVNKSCVSGSAGASVSIGYGGARASAGAGVSLGADAYRSTCPRAEEIIRAAVERAVAADPRMAASLLRLHFHDCFVNGCDGSVLLDDKPFFIGEKTAVPNANSIRGFEVIDAIKTELERECPDTVSCADLLAIAARDSVVVVCAHTIGKARCTSFSARLAGAGGVSEGGAGAFKDLTFLQSLQQLCTGSAGSALAHLDLATPATFDNQYYINLLSGDGLLPSDQALASSAAVPGVEADVASLVATYAFDASVFFQDFAESMLRMGRLAPGVGTSGEVRRNCRVVNSSE